MSLRTLLEALRGYGEGATLGAIKYPQAALMTVVNNEPYRDNLAEIERQRRELESSPAYQVARVGGGFVPAIASGGGSLGVVAAKQAAQGAVSGFTANEGMDNVLRDTGLGGAVGGGFGLLGGGVQALGNFSRRQLSKNPNVIAAASQELQERAMRDMGSVLADPKAAAIYNGFKDGTLKLPKPTKRSEQLTGEERWAYETARLAAAKKADVAPETAAAARSVIQGTLPRAGVLKKQVEEGTFKAKGRILLNDLADDAKAMLPYVAGGAGAGLGLSATGLLPENASTLQVMGGLALLGGGLSAIPQLGNLKIKGGATAAALLPKQGARPVVPFGRVPQMREVVSPTVLSSASASGALTPSLQQIRHLEVEQQARQLRELYEREEEE
jgi:hypothetical protein